MLRKVLITFMLVAALVLMGCGGGGSQGGFQENVIRRTGEGREEGMRVDAEGDRRATVVLNLQMGERADIGPVAVTVGEPVTITSYDYHSVITDSIKTREASVGYVFLLVTITVENLSEGPQFVPYGFCWIRQSGGRTRRLIEYWGDDALRSRVEIPPGEQVTGKRCFMIPDYIKWSRVVVDFTSFLTEFKQGEWEWQID